MVIVVDVQSSKVLVVVLAANDRVKAARPVKVEGKFTREGKIHKTHCC